MKWTTENITEISPSGIEVSDGRIGLWEKGGYVSFPEVSFSGINSIKLTISNEIMVRQRGEAFALYLDNPLSGECIGYALVNRPYTEPTELSFPIKKVSGTHKLYIKYNYNDCPKLYLYSVELSKKETNYAVTPIEDKYIQDYYSDTWTITDPLGRKAADFEEVGPVKEQKHDVLMFYHNWHIQGGQVIKIPELLKKYPDAKYNFDHPAWKGYWDAFWSESVYGFYDGRDFWHYRKQAELMAYAGIDAVFLDYTNPSLTYSYELAVMLKAFHDARAAGVNCPKVSCYLPMGCPDDARLLMLKAVYFNLCYTEEYKDLWYYVDGKPLLMLVWPQNARNAVTPGDTAEMKLVDDMLSFFTFRESGHRMEGNPGEKNMWHWLVPYPQHEWSTTSDGRTECVNLGMAINLSYDDAHKDMPWWAFNDEKTMGKSYSGAFGEDFRPEAIHEGYFFREQARRVLDVDPAYAFVCGWNEWVTCRSPIFGNSENFAGITNAFLDLFDEEHSRDFEPSRSILKDEYFHFLVDFVRKYKGVRPVPVASAPKTIDITKGASDFEDVYPLFSTAPTNYERNEVTCFSEYDTNKTYQYSTKVINTIVSAKVARDDKYIYFLVNCSDDIKVGHKGFLTLYINTDRNPATGWEGYNYVLNASSIGTLSRFTDNGSNLVDITSVDHRISGKTFTAKIPRRIISPGFNVEFEFKWSDNVLPDGDFLKFYTDGSVAPVGRFNFLYTENPQTSLSSEERDSLKDVSLLKAKAQKMIVNGSKMNIYDKDLRVRAFEDNGTLYLPLTAVEEILGYGLSKAYYDSETESLHFMIHHLEGREIKGVKHYNISLNSLNAIGTVDGNISIISLASPCIEKNGIIFCPLTLLSDCFKLPVKSLGEGIYVVGKCDITKSDADKLKIHFN